MLNPRGKTLGIPGPFCLGTLGIFGNIWELWGTFGNFGNFWEFLGTIGNFSQILRISGNFYVKLVDMSTPKHHTGLYWVDTLTAVLFLSKQKKTFFRVVQWANINKNV
jgi:hypothetical protein